jgi:hypothetical protein
MKDSFRSMLKSCICVQQNNANNFPALLEHVVLSALLKPSSSVPCKTRLVKANQDK